jgi:hypothetical protein
MIELVKKSKLFSAEGFWCVLPAFRTSVRVVRKQVINSMFFAKVGDAGGWFIEAGQWIR